MKLKCLEIHGFKSFFEKTNITFDQGITGIVGPNGSGKSNIGDAMRWVLGEQSAKVLRGAKMEDVIFNGTQKRKRSSFCEVSLVFDNEDQTLRSVYSEVRVTRSVFRNGDSEYLLNKAPCRLRDILELFRDTGIGKEGYSLIGQGRIDEILSTKSQDRRAIFEEAAGIVTFRVRKEDAEKKLVKTEDNLTRVYDILMELEHRLVPLEKQAKVAIEYQGLFDTLRTMDIRVFLVRYDKVNAKVFSLGTVKAELEGTLTEHQQALQTLAGERNTLDETLEQIEVFLLDKRQEQRNQTQLAHENQRLIDRLLLNQETTAQEEVRFINQIDENKERLQSLSTNNETQTAQEQSVNEELSRAKTALAQSVLALEQQTQATQEAENALETHRTNLLQALDRMSDARDQHTRQQTILTQMQSKLEELESQLLLSAQNRQTLVENVAQAHLQCEQSKNATDALVQKLQSEEMALRKSKEEIAHSTTRMNELSLEIRSLQSRHKLLDEMARDMEGYYLSVKKALAEFKLDPNVHGVLAQLIHVPKEYETALDMVLGATLQNIITTDEQTAKYVINYLKQNRFGRATFLPISAIRPRLLSQREEEVLRMKGCIGVVSDLIECDPIYRPIVENLLGRTILSDTLDNGIQIMRRGNHAFRLVTLSGEVMHTGGSITGGTTNSKNISLIGREREITDLLNTIKGKQTDFNQSMSALTALKETQNTKQQAYESLLRKKHQAEIAIARDMEKEQHANSELTAQDEEITKYEWTKEQLTDGTLQLLEDVEKAKEETNVVFEDKENMDKKTADLQQLLYDARERADIARENVDFARLTVVEATHQLELFHNEQRQRAQTLEEVRNVIQRAQDGLTECGRKQAQTVQEITSAQATQDTLSEGLESIEREIQQTTDKRAVLSADRRDCIQKSDELHAMHDELSGVFHKTELALSKANDDLSQMCEQLFQRYELTYATAQQYQANTKNDEEFDLTETEKQATSLRQRIRALGTINVSAIEEYATEKERYDNLTLQRDDLLKAKEDLQALIQRLLKEMEKVFVGEFNKLGEYFKETFERLFGGGQANLQLADPQNPLDCGIDIVAQPPGKKLQMLSLLSGGERALTAIAILFAMLKLKPTPFCILDEIEAALDEANITYFADYLAEYKNATQFVVVTHRKGTMERCDALYGVAMEEQGVSRMVSVDLRTFEE